MLASPVLFLPQLPRIWLALSTPTSSRWIDGFRCMCFPARTIFAVSWRARYIGQPQWPSYWPSCSPVVISCSFRRYSTAESALACGRDAIRRSPPPDFTKPSGLYRLVWSQNCWPMSLALDISVLGDWRTVDASVVKCHFAAHRIPTLRCLLDLEKTTSRPAGPWTWPTRTPENIAST